MAQNFTLIQHALNGGEVSFRYGGGRQDQNKRQTGLEICENWLALTVGGVFRRPGSVFVAWVKSVPDHPIKRMIRFVAANDAAYAIEMGHQYMRFYRNGLPIFSSPAVPMEVVTPYADTDLADIHCEAQSIDVKYFFHTAYPPQKLSRTSATTFVFSAVVFDPSATIEDEPTGTDLSAGTLTPDVVSGDGVTFTSIGSPFLATDVGRLIISGAGRALIVTVPTDHTVTADILDPFASTDPIAAGSWRLKLSPQTEIDVEDGRKELGQVVNLTASAAAFRPQDVNKWITIFGGLVQITEVISTTIVRGTIKSQLKDIDDDDDDPDPTRAWTLEIADWSAARGYPSCGTFFKERLWIFKGLRCNGSVTNDFENFSKGSTDDNAIARTISDDDIDAIVWAKGIDTLFVGTGSGVFELKPATEGAALTPTDFNAVPVTNRGVAKIAPVRISGLLHYVQIGQRRLRELVFDFATNKFASPNLFQLAEHLTESYYITEIFYAAEPDSFVYCRRSDGTFLVLVYQEEEKVLGWARITTNGTYLSGCEIPRPSTGKSWVWYIVERDNGTFVEYFEPDRMNSGREWNEAQTDACVFTTPNAEFKVVTGLEHLEGQTVRVIGDGMLYEDAVVTDGEITLDPPVACDVVEIGLNYDSIGLTLEPIIPPEIGGPLMTANYEKIGVRIRRALGLTINGEEMIYRRAADFMDTAVPLQRGKLALTTLKGDPFNRISFKQLKPFPAEIINIFGRINVGDAWTADTEDDGTPPFQFKT